MTARLVTGVKQNAAGVRDTSRVPFLYVGLARENQRHANQSEATRFDRRDILRATVFLWSTPRATPRASSGCAA